MPRRLLLAFLLVASVALWPAGDASADAERELPPGWIALGEPQWLPLAPPGGLVLPQALAFFTDCGGSSRAPRSCGPPPARWISPLNPVTFCTVQAGRPSSISADTYRSVVARAAATWNSQEAGIGVRYGGDCAGGRWNFEDDVNQLGWDDTRQAVTGSEAGITRGSWLLLPGDVKEFVEADVVFDGDSLVGVPPQCLEAVIAHEMGHAIGLGHSDVRGDLMYPSFSPNDISTCTTRPSAFEQSRLQSLYGLDRNPVMQSPAGRTVEPGSTVTLSAPASDPEGGPLAYEWALLSGPTVGLSAQGDSMTFTAPLETPAKLAFQVTVLDRFLHRATATVSVTVNAATAPPVEAPSLASFLSAPGAADAVLTWTESASAVTYELCSRPVEQPVAPVCQLLGTPSAGVSWDTVLGAMGVADDWRVFTTGARETSLRGCNSKGCTLDGAGGLTGGLRWSSWDVDYDYFALAYDVPSASFTIAGVVNVSGSARVFTLQTGPANDPTQGMIRFCGRLEPGDACIGFLGPGNQHHEFVDILGQAPGAPTTEHRIRVR